MVLCFCIKGRNRKKECYLCNTVAFFRNKKDTALQNPPKFVDEFCRTVSQNLRVQAAVLLPAPYYRWSFMEIILKMEPILSIAKHAAMPLYTMPVKGTKTSIYPVLSHLIRLLPRSHFTDSSASISSSVTVASGQRISAF